VFSANDLIQAVQASPPRSRRKRLAPVNLWQILTGLLRDADLLNSRDAPRRWHWLALVLALLYQTLWCLALIWLIYIPFLIIPWAPPETGDGGDGMGGAIEVTFIDEPRPDVTAEPTPLPEPLAQTWPPPLPENQPVPLPEPLAEPPPIPLPATAEPRPDPVPAPPVPLVVTEVDSPDEDAFTLHVPQFQHPQPPELAPALSEPALSLPIADVPLLQRPDLQRPSLPFRPPETPLPELALPEHDIPAPLPELVLRPLEPSPPPTIELPSHSRRIAEHEIPLPLDTPELRPLPPIEQPVVEDAPAPTRDISEREIALTPPSPEPAPAVISDSWELPSSDPAPGTGLFDAQGRPQLAGSGGGGGGLPPGTLIEDYANIDRMGTWLKRPTADFQPGPLDQLWVPHENILEEWVRRSIKNIWIPIPGTNKVIRCTVVLLMLGGGCGVTDPNLLDIEATSRPPPDIPFKPELHEDQESLRPPRED